MSVPTIHQLHLQIPTQKLQLRDINSYYQFYIEIAVCEHSNHRCITRLKITSLTAQFNFSILWCIMTNQYDKQIYQLHFHQFQIKTKQLTIPEFVIQFQLQCN